VDEFFFCFVLFLNLLAVLEFEHKLTLARQALLPIQLLQWMSFQKEKKKNPKTTSLG
jgi:hypothetical protein